MAIEDKERQNAQDEKLRSFDTARLRKAVREIIQAVGEDPNREGLIETPRRVADMYAEVFSGLREDPADVLRVGFEEGHQELVLVKDIPFYSMCEHHFLPVSWRGAYRLYSQRARRGALEAGARAGDPGAPPTVTGAPDQPARRRHHVHAWSQPASPWSSKRVTSV